MEKDTIDQIKNKSFIELSAEEKESMKDLFTTEGEFNEIKAMFLQIDGLSAESFQPSEKVKGELDDLYSQHYPIAPSNSFFALIVPKNKPIYRQPLVQIAALILLLLLIVPMFNSPLVEETIQVAKLEKMEENEIKTVDDENTEKTIEQEKSLVEDVSEVSTTEPKEVLVDGNSLSQVEFDVAATSRRTPAPVQTRSVVLEKLSDDESVVTVSTVFSNHPDGIYKAGDEEVKIVSFSTQESSDLLDLLSTTF